MTRPRLNQDVKWVFHHKGGEYKKWYGNHEYVIYWENDGQLVKSMPNSGIQGQKAFNHDAVVWSDITSGGFSARLKPKNFLFDSASPLGLTLDWLCCTNLSVKAFSAI